jgi:hypothetical protein
MEKRTGPDFTFVTNQPAALYYLRHDACNSGKHGSYLFRARGKPSMSFAAFKALPSPRRAHHSPHPVPQASYGELTTTLEENLPV